MMIMLSSQACVSSSFKAFFLDFVTLYYCALILLYTTDFYTHSVLQTIQTTNQFSLFSQKLIHVPKCNSSPIILSTELQNKFEYAYLFIFLNSFILEHILFI